MLKSASLAFAGAAHASRFCGMFSRRDKGGEKRRRGGPQLVLEQLSAHSSATCSTLVLDDSCIRGYFCRKSFLILQVGAEFFFFFDRMDLECGGKK